MPRLHDIATTGPIFENRILCGWWLFFTVVSKAPPFGGFVDHVVVDMPQVKALRDGLARAGSRRAFCGTKAGP